jgi:hypothetical protein
MNWLIVMQYMSQMTTDMFGLSKSQSCRVPLVKQELLTIPKHQSSLLIFNGLRVSQSLVFYVLFCKKFVVVFLITISLSVFRVAASG